MSDAQPGADAPSYDLRPHPRAVSEIESFHPEVAEDVKTKIRQAARTPEPTSLGCITHLKGGDGLFRIKGDGVRVVCELRNPVFAVLLAGKRRTVYDRLDTAIDRAAEVFGDV